jgi:hypothetical protein
VLNSSAKPAQLTESETEYQVSCVKHIFAEHVVFQFNVSNTLQETVLEQIAVVMQPSADAGLTEDFIIQLSSLSVSSSPGILYVSFTRDDPSAFAMTSFSCVLKFISKEVDPATGEPEEEGYEDEYQLEDVELSAGGDYLIPSYANFSAEWDRLKSGATATETFALSAMESIKGSHRYSPDPSLRRVHGIRSGLRLNCRNPRSRAAGWLAHAHEPVRAHDATLRYAHRRRRQSAGALPDDVLTWAGCHARAGRPGGESGGV